MSARLTLASLTIALVATNAAHAQDLPDGATWLPGAGHAISRSTSASRDAPVIEYAYGPHAQASLGVEPALFAITTDAARWRVGVSALIALENGSNRTSIAPNEFTRARAELFAAIELRALARKLLPRDGVVELTFGVGRESADSLGHNRPDVASPRDLPFGGGGDWLSFDLALRSPLGHGFELTLRLGDRVYWNAFPLIFGAQMASDVVASDLRESLLDEASAELIVRWRATTWMHPTLSLFAERLISHDALANDGTFARALLGAVLPGRAGELEPFVSFDAGSGKGLLIDRRELRLSLGVRDAIF
ncbi:MAG: hypothetical protein ACHREM_27010 [Polyangiales bacterium]